VAKKMKKTVLFSTLFTALMSTTSFADNMDKLAIDVMSDAKIFAKLDDEIPAVVNYFTKSSEANIVTFYEEKYGKSTSSDRKRGRLEKSFIKDSFNIKVIISEQNNQRQVDVLVTK
jgi:hypothetical protein